MQIGNIDWKHCRLETLKSIGNKKCTLETLELDWKQKTYIGNIKNILKTKKVHWKHCSSETSF